MPASGRDVARCDGFPGPGMRIRIFGKYLVGIYCFCRHNLYGGFDKMDANAVMFRWVVDFFTALDLGRNN